MKKLEVAASDRYIYMHAPAGSGKTVSALLWNTACDAALERQMSQRQISQQQMSQRQMSQRQLSLWISLDAFDNVPSVFYKLLSSVLCSTQPHNENMFSVLTDPAFSSAPVEHTVRLLAEIQPDERLFNLTFDDLHLIDNPDIHRSLPVVLRRLPRSFVVLFLSRAEPPLPLRELFRNEKTAFIGVDDLKFSEKELRAYYQNLGRELPDEEAGFILMATGGMAIGINAIARSGHSQSGTAEYSFGSYVREQLWVNWDNSLCDFLLKTSAVDEMTERLAIILTGRRDAGKVLQELCTANTFVSRAGKDLYRYHHLFLEFLRGMAKESGLNFSPLYKAAANYFLDAKQYLVARRYAVQSGYDKMILKVIYNFHQYSNPNYDEYLAYAKIFNPDTLPEGIYDRYPYLYTTLMEASWISGDVKMAEYTWDRMRKHLPLIAIKYPKMLETVILELSVDHRKPFTKLIAEFKKLPPVMRPSRKYQVGSLSLQLPFAHRSIRNYCELADRDVMEKLKYSFGLLLKDLWETVRRCLSSGLALEKNNIEEALSHALLAREAAAGIESPEIIFLSHNHLTAAYLAMGNEELMHESLAETERYLNKSGAYYLDRNFLALKAKILLMNADKNAAEEWLDNYFVGDGDRVPLDKYFQYLTTARACIVLNKGGRAMAVLEKLEKFARSYRRSLDLAEVLTLKASLYWASGRRAEAAGALEEALLELQPFGFIRIVADEGSSVVPVLKRVVAAINGEGYAGKLSETYVMEVLLAAHRTSKRFKGITANFKKKDKPVKLSKQQKKVLELLAKGCKNHQIAELTGLTLPTVKWHLTHAYEKLEVHNAMDALLKAKTLGLL